MRLPFAVLAALCPAFAAAADLPAGAYARLGSSAWLHPEQPTAFAFHPDGKRVASGGNDGVVRVWEVASGKELNVIRRKEGSVAAIAFSADGKWLAAHFGDEFIRLYETDKFVEKHSVPVKNVDQLGLSADAKLVAASGALGENHLVEVESGQERMELPKGRAVALAPDGASVAVANDVNAVHILEIPSGKPLHAYPLPNEDKSPVTNIAFHPLGKRIAIATGGPKPQIRAFELGQKEPKTTVAGEGPVAFLGETAVAGRVGGKLAVWELTTGKLLRTMGEGVTAFAVNKDGTMAVTDGGAFFPSPRIHLWGLTDGKSKNRAPDEVTDIRAVTAAPTGEVVIATGSNLMAWKLGDGKPTVVAKGEYRTAAAFGKSVIVAANDQLAKLDSPTKPFAKLPAGAKFVAGNADLIAVAAAGEKPELTMLHGTKGSVIRGWPLPGMPLGVAVDPAGKRVAVVGRDGFVRVWNADADGKGKTPPELWKERTARSFRAGIQFSPDGKTLAFTSLMRVSLLDAETGKLVLSFERSWDDGPFTSLAFTPDGRFLAAGTQGGAGSAVVWELVSRQRAGRHTPGGGTVVGVAFTDGGKTLVTTGIDDNVTAWDRTGRRDKAAPKPSELADAWRQLGDADPELAWIGVATLAAGGKDSLALTRERLDDQKVLAKAVEKWVAELGSKDFNTRETATKELVAVGGPALPVIEKFEKLQQTAEWTTRAKTVRGRIQMAAEKLPDPALVGVPLTLIRATAALEQIGSPAAKELLEEIRKLGGLAGVEAAAALARLGK